MIYNALCLIYTEEIKTVDNMKSAQCLIVPDGMTINTTMMGKSVYLSSATLYKIPVNKNAREVKIVADLEPSQIKVPRDYKQKYALVNNYLKNTNVNWEEFCKPARSYSKIVSINAEENRKMEENKRSRVKKQILRTDREKINLVLATMYEKKFVLDLSANKLSPDDTYVINYQVYQNLSGKKMEFFSTTFVYNKENDYLELPEDKTNYFTSWWAITLYVLGSLLIVGMIVSACSKN